MYIVVNTFLFFFNFYECLMNLDATLNSLTCVLISLLSCHRVEGQH